MSDARCSVSDARGMPPVARVVPRLERVEGVVARVLDQVHMQLVDLLARRAEGQCGTHQIRYCKMLAHCVRRPLPLEPLSAKNALAHDVVDHRPNLLVDVNCLLRSEVRQPAVQSSPAVQ